MKGIIISSIEKWSHFGRRCTASKYACITRVYNPLSLPVLFQTGAGMHSVESDLLSLQLSTSDGPPQAVVVQSVVPPSVPYETWKEFSTLLFLVQDEYCACLVKSMCMELENGSALQSGGSLHLPHLVTQGPSLIMRLTKQRGAFWCRMVANFVYSRVLRAAEVYHRVREQVHADTDTEHERTGLIVHLIQTMQDEVRHTFSTAMPFSIYSLSSGFVSTLMIENFKFYDDAELTAFTDAEVERLLLTLCMGLHRRLGMNSPLLSTKDDILQIICARLFTSKLRVHVAFQTRRELLFF